MKRTYSVYTKYLEFEVEIQTKTVESHSVISDDTEMGKELKEALVRGIEHMKEEILSFEWKFSSDLAKVGK